MPRPNTDPLSEAGLVMESLIVGFKTPRSFMVVPFSAASPR